MLPTTRAGGGITIPPVLVFLGVYLLYSYLQGGKTVAEKSISYLMGLSADRLRRVMEHSDHFHESFYNFHHFAMNFLACCRQGEEEIVLLFTKNCDI